ncbi:MAG: hypothetical protein ACLGHW_06490 [Gammaproteobacteria bacterium]
MSAFHVGQEPRTATSLIDQLIGAADALVGSIQTLRTHPTAEHAARVVHAVSGVHRTAGLTLGALLREEGRQDGH